MHSKRVFCDCCLLSSCSFADQVNRKKREERKENHQKFTFPIASSRVWRKRVYWMSKCSGCRRASDFTRMVFLVKSSISWSHLPPLAFRALATSGLTRSITSRSKCRAIFRSSTYISLHTVVTDLIMPVAWQVGHGWPSV